MLWQRMQGRLMQRPGRHSDACAQAIGPSYRHHTLTGLPNCPKYSDDRKMSSWQMSMDKPTAYTRFRCTTRTLCTRARALRSRTVRKPQTCSSAKYMVAGVS